MAKQMSAAQMQQINAQIAADPRVRQILSGPDSGGFGKMGQLTQYLQKTYGANIPPDFQLALSKDGTPSVQEKTFIEKHGDWLIPLTLVGGAFGAGALTGAFGAGAGGTAAGTAGGSTAAGSTAAAGGTAAGTAAGGGTAAGTAAGAAATTPWWQTALAVGVPAATSVIGGVLQSNAVKDAAKIQAESAQKALDTQKEMYDLYRRDSGPYRNAGVSSLGAMSSLLGLPDPGGVGPEPPTMQAQRDAAVPVIADKTQSALSTWFGGGEATTPTAQSATSYVTMQAPTGQTKQVPAGEVQHWISKGARQV